MTLEQLKYAINGIHSDFDKALVEIRTYQGLHFDIDAVAVDQLEDKPVVIQIFIKS